MLRKAQARLHVDKGSYLFHQNETPRGIYLLLRGDMDMYVQNTQKMIGLAPITPGRLFDLSAIVLDARHGYSALARNEVEVAFLSMQLWREATEKCPALYAPLSRQLSHSLREMRALIGMLESGEATLPALPGHP